MYILASQLFQIKNTFGHIYSWMNLCGGIIRGLDNI